MTRADDVDTALAGLADAARGLRGAVRVLRVWTICAIAGVVLALAALGVGAWDVHHNAVARQQEQCANAKERVEVTAHTIDGIWSAILVETADDPDATAAVKRVRSQADALLKVRLANLPEC